MKIILFSLLLTSAGSISCLAQGAGNEYPFSVTLTGTTSCTFTPLDVSFQVGKTAITVLPSVQIASSSEMAHQVPITITKLVDGCSAMIVKELFAGKSMKGVITVSARVSGVFTVVQTITLYSATITDITVDSGSGSSGAKNMETVSIDIFSIDVTGT